ncbi:Helix-loop-helix DNA-binding domain protein [Ancylostoma caninum]|uniref:Helix-loop-helix DNA-binding domain protein n=1 Tax=Ancylostoma caninum TaxID=29170 RepID=A0A368G7T9_ANCCA|nr:Helix-loop-helix DNA-binding domain protein [Ancylostoma caninum]
MTRQSSSSSSPDEHRRLRSTLKEKRRNIEINDAFEKLQRQLPHVPASTRLPKIKTLRLALKYIEHLSTILNGDKQVITSLQFVNIRGWKVLFLFFTPSKKEYFNDV